MHSDIDAAFELDAEGVHLTSSQFDEIEIAKDRGLFTVISTHSIDEIKEAEKAGADMVTISPVFPSPNKGKPLGIEYLSEALAAAKIPVIALGGIVTEDEIEKVKSAGAAGFASIRYFVP